MGNRGQVLHEYAIALALIALLSVGALKLLGGNISNLFQQSTSAEATQKTEQLYSLVGASLKNGNNATTQSTNASSASSQPSKVTLKIDPATGQVVIQDATGSNTNFTSLDGGTVMSLAAQQLALLANTKLAGNQPLPNDMQMLLKQLSQTGTNLSGYFDELDTVRQQLVPFNKVIDQQNAQGQFSGPPYYDATMVNQVIAYTNQDIQFSALYQQLSSQLDTLPASDPAVIALKKQVDDYTGAISSISQDNVGAPFFSELHIEHVNSSDLTTALQNNSATAPYFQLLNDQSANMAPAEREVFFQQAIVSMGKQMQVGTPITDSQGIQLALDGS